MDFIDNIIGPDVAVAVSGAWIGLYRQQSVVAGDTKASSTAENLFTDGKYTFAANALKVGQVIRATFAGVSSISTNGGITTLKLKWGTTVLATVTLENPNFGAKANIPWSVVFNLVVVSLGATGTIEVQPIPGGTSYDVGGGGTVGINMEPTANTAVKTIDTTASTALQLSEQHGTNGASDSITMRFSMIETAWN